MSRITEFAPQSVAVVYGTRPEMIKLAPLVGMLGDGAKRVHTGQHFDVEMSDDIAGDMELADPHARVYIGGKTRASQLGGGIEGLEPHLAGSRAVVVQGDTNSSLAGAVTANALEIPLFHVEAGLRSFDRRMPEEHNRVLIDHLADLCWAPTEGNVKNLLAEGIESDRIEKTGNSVVEALEKVVPDAASRASRRRELDLPDHDYVLTTIHRPENVDDPDRLAALLRVLAALGRPVVFPMHPRTRATVEANGLRSLLDPIAVTVPLGYRDFLSLLADCSLAISDSGGIQEEVSVLKVPVVVVRRSTERPEALDTFATLLCEPGDVLEESRRLLEMGQEHHDRLASVESPFGDGLASQRMYESLRRHLG